MTYTTYPSLADRVVFVTGGATGIGADIVRAFSANSSRVAFVDIAEMEGQALAAETDALFLHCDITDIPALRTAIAQAGERLGPVGVLVNNAANDLRQAIDSIEVADWDWSMDINLKPQFFAAQAVRPQMQRLGGGSIINFSSVIWRLGAETTPAYGSAKAAVLGLTRALARGFGRDRIRVNAIEPGAVMTERQRKLWYPTPEQASAIVSRQILPDELLGHHISKTVLFLAADDSSMITNQSIIVDAGLAG